MSHRLLLATFASLAACGAPSHRAGRGPGEAVAMNQPSPSPSPSPATPAPPSSAALLGPQTAPDGRIFAVVASVKMIEECSNAGGEHYVFAVDDAGGNA